MRRTQEGSPGGSGDPTWAAGRERAVRGQRWTMASWRPELPKQGWTMCVRHGEKAELLPRGADSKTHVPKSLPRTSLPKPPGCPSLGRWQGPGRHASSAPDYNQSQGHWLTGPHSHRAPW